MAQKLIQTQAQKLQQLQRLSAQQMLQVKLLEMPLTELEDSINAELDDNPALESENPDDMLSESYDGDSPLEHDADSSNSDSDTDSDDAYEAQSEKEERKDELDQALESIGQDDQMPDYSSDKYGNQDTAEYEEMVYGDTTSFYDKLKEQMDMQNLTDKEKEVMEYLIGSLDDDGLLRKDLDSISDELMIYHNIYNSWSWTGGHADGETDLLAVALREVAEETGLQTLRPVSRELFSVEILTVDGHEKRGWYVPSHLHLNCTYLIEADDTEPLRVKPDENSGVRWFAPREALAACTEPWMRDRIYQKLIEKNTQYK